MSQLIHDLPPLRELIDNQDLKAKKGLGQNFLFDLNLTAKIARSAGITADTTVIEIGPGPGGLTRALLTETPAKKVIALEKDLRFVSALQPLVQAAQGRLSLHQADALEADPIAIAPSPRAIVANLPYNVATPLLLGWIKNIENYQSLTLMFQKEVAERIVAKPKTKAYGRLSIMAQWLCHTDIIFDLPPSAFTPPPKVTSSIIYLSARKRTDSIAFDMMEMVVAKAFNQRRKMLRQSMKSINIDWENIGIAPTKRAEELSIEEFCAIAQSLSV